MGIGYCHIIGGQLGSTHVTFLRLSFLLCKINIMFIFGLFGNQKIKIKDINE